MSSINTGSMRQYIQTYDINKDGKLDRPEIAKGSLNLLGQESAQSQTAGRIFATFVQGGTDQQGLFPDFDGDEAVDFAEFSRLAAASGNSNAIEAEDMQSTFGNRFQAGGSDLDIEGLQQVAEGNLNKFTIDPDNPQEFVNSVDSLTDGSLGQKALDLFQIVLQLLISIFS